jgi:glycosyltransferase involved in cell wall biosynthesis
MIRSDGRLSTRVVDCLLTRPLINKSLSNLLLTESELKSTSRLNITSPSIILPNGIYIAEPKIQVNKKVGRIAFCSRLEKRKGVRHFLDLAETFKSSGAQFEIYGPDGGELSTVNEVITTKNIEKTVTYMGAIPAHEVQSVLKSIDLLVLPSKDEPFPMIVLEALAVGTPVLVMPSCGIATVLKEFRSGYVSKTEDIEGLIAALSRFLENAQAESPESIQEFCRTQFSIESVCTKLISIYAHSKPALMGDSK